MNTSNSLKETNSIYNKSNPLITTIKNRYLLTSRTSSKATYHVALDLKGEPLPFKVGDSLAVFPQNNPFLVEHLLKLLRAKGDEVVVDPRSQKPISILDFLTFKANLGRVTSSFLKLVYEHEKDLNKQHHIAHLLDKDHKEELSHYILHHDTVDLFQEHYPLDIPLQEVCEKFSPLLPRFYSIASSPFFCPNEIHLTVALFSFSHGHEMRFGVASHFLSELAEENKTPIPVYLQPNIHGFTLPEDANTPLIMIGPGTGIAPFKAFLEERMHFNHPGKNWLFFGARNSHTDFLYKDFLLNLQDKGKLKLSLAFSRDQEHKIYVQHRMEQEAALLWQWLQDGAVIYVCGDASQMAKDVEKTLLLILAKQGKMSEEEAKLYLKQLKASKRYLLDVY